MEITVFVPVNLITILLPFVVFALFLLFARTNPGNKAA